MDWETENEEAERLARQCTCCLKSIDPEVDTSGLCSECLKHYNEKEYDPIAQASVEAFDINFFCQECGNNDTVHRCTSCGIFVDHGIVVCPECKDYYDSEHDNIRLGTD